jgi:hypothetical protein
MKTLEEKRVAGERNFQKMFSKGTAMWPAHYLTQVADPSPIRIWLEGTHLM